VAAPPLPRHRGRPRRGHPRRPAHRGSAAGSRSRPGATLDLAAPGRLGGRGVRGQLLPRDDPHGPASPGAVLPGAVLEKGPEAARPGRPAAAAGFRRQAFVEQIQDLLAGAQHDRHLLVYLDEAHIHQDAGLGHGWSARGRRFWVASGSPRLADKLSFYGLYLYNEGAVRLWPYARANGEHTIDVLRRLRAEWPDRRLILVWDGAPYHRAGLVREAAAALRIDLVPLPGYSPDLMPVEALWRWLREDVTYHHCHPTAEDLSRRVAAFEARLNQDRCTVADRLWVKDQLDPEEEKLRFSN
jgi:transposase